MKIGIDLGGSHIAIGVIDDKCYIVEKAEKRLLSKDKKDIKTSIETYIVKNVKELMEKYKNKRNRDCSTGNNKKYRNNKISKFRCKKL